MREVNGRGVQPHLWQTHPLLKLHSHAHMPVHLHERACGHGDARFWTSEILNGQWAETGKTDKTGNNSSLLLN